MSDEKKLTVVLGASPDRSRYSNLAVNRLSSHGHEVVPVGIRSGEIAGIEIVKGTPPLEGVDTVTLYLNAGRQKQYYDYIFSLHPARLIFNPGAENDELAELAEKNGIQAQEACTLVLLSTGQF